MGSGSLEGLLVKVSPPFFFVTSIHCVHFRFFIAYSNHGVTRSDRCRFSICGSLWWSVVSAWSQHARECGNVTLTTHLRMTALAIAVESPISPDQHSSIRALVFIGDANWCTDGHICSVYLRYPESSKHVVTLHDTRPDVSLCTPK